MSEIRRTDLALEAKELWNEAHPGEPDGVVHSEKTDRGFTVSETRILDDRGSSALCKPIGRYITIELQRLLRREDGAFSDCAHVLAGSLTSLLNLEDGDTVLVVGLGNSSITPDAIGHLTLRSTLVTRHLTQSSPEDFAAFRPVAALEPGVLGTTGMESAQIIRSVVGDIHPAAVLAIDALASRSMSRICRTLQLTDTGIIPGSGIGNGRQELSEKTLGVPVIAMGVPTVVDAATLAADLALNAGVELDEDALRRDCGSMIVTPRDIDSAAAGISRLMGYGINLALHPALSVEDVDLFLS